MLGSCDSTWQASIQPHLRIPGDFYNRESELYSESLPSLFLACDFFLSLSTVLNLRPGLEATVVIYSFSTLALLILWGRQFFLPRSCPVIPHQGCLATFLTSSPSLSSLSGHHRCRETWPRVPGDTATLEEARCVLGSPALSCCALFRTCQMERRKCPVSVCSPCSWCMLIRLAHPKDPFLVG